ncbi:MAG: Rieske 2Fe-2S domain-containing protein [Bryobacteraceae bacterium]
MADPAKLKVVPSDRVPEGGRIVVDLRPGLTAGLFRVEGQLYAYENCCPHQGGPVCQGMLIPAVRELLNSARASTGFAFDDHDPRIVCPWHGFEFSIKTGCHPSDPSIRLNALRVEEQEGWIYVWA